MINDALLYKIAVRFTRKRKMNEFESGLSHGPNGDMWSYPKCKKECEKESYVNTDYEEYYTEIRCKKCGYIFKETPTNE